MTLAVYGGSFDPPHVGHVLAVHYVLSAGLADRVLVVPVFEHALSKDLTPFSTRMEMCELAFCTDSRITVSGLEAELSRPSYTLHTLQRLRELHPEESLRLVVGADVLPETPRWHEFEEVEKLAPLLVLGRAGIESEVAPEPILPAVSSTEARTWWAEGAGPEARAKRERLIPAKVREVIDRDRLYRS